MISRTPPIPLMMIRCLSNRMRCLLRLLPAVVLAFGAGACEASQNRLFTDGPQSLEVVLPYGFVPYYGYLPVRVTAGNPGSAAVEWRLTVNASVSGHHDTNLNPGGLAERVVVPAGQTIERGMLVPVGRFGPPSWANLQIMARKPSGEMENWGHSWSESDHWSGKACLIGERTRDKTGGLRIPSNRTANHWLKPEAAPGDWRGFSQFQLVVLNADDWNALPQAARAALGDWTRFGGQLQFTGAMPSDAPVPDVPGSPARGLGAVYGMPAPGPAEESIDFEDLPGVKALAKQTGVASDSRERGDALVGDWLGKNRPDLIEDRFTSWPMVLVLIAFFVMITPVNLFILAPSRRRYRLFLTIPAISLTACALLALAVLLGDGFGGRGERLVWIESRPGAENRIFLNQWQASRCGALFGDRFTVDDAALLSPMRVPGSDLKLQVAGQRVDAGGGWFTSRATQAQFLQAARPGRGRLEWTKDGGDPTVVSTFDFPLRDVYASADGSEWWHAAEVRQGESAKMRRIGLPAIEAALAESLKSLPPSDKMRAMAMRPGHFIAFTDSPPAIGTLAPIRWRDTGVVTGALAPR